MDDVAAGLPEGFTGTDDPGRLAFQFEDHFAFDHVPENGSRTGGVTVVPGSPGGNSITATSRRPMPDRSSVSGRTLVS